MSDSSVCFVGAGVSALAAAGFGYFSHRNKKVYEELKTLPVDSVESMAVRLQGGGHDASPSQVYGIVRAQAAGSVLCSPYTSADQDLVAFQEQQLEIRTTNEERVQRHYDAEGRETGSTRSVVPTAHTTELDRHTYGGHLCATSCFDRQRDGASASAKLLLCGDEFTPLYSSWKRFNVAALKKDEHKWHEEARAAQLDPVRAPVQVHNVLTNSSGGDGGSCRYAVNRRAIARGQWFTAMGTFSTRQAPVASATEGSVTLGVCDPQQGRRPYVITLREPGAVLNDWRETSNGQAIAASFLGILAVGLTGAGFYNRNSF